MFSKEKYLKPTNYIDFPDERLVSQANRLTRGCGDVQNIVYRFFHYTRDNILFDQYEDTNPASIVYVFQRGNSIGKACLLAALCRVKGIPAGIKFFKLEDQKVERLIKRRKIEELHGVTGVWLDNRWIVIDASSDRWFALARGTHVPEFDGSHDVFLPEYDMQMNANYKILDESDIFYDLPKCLSKKGVERNVCDNCGVRCYWRPVSQQPIKG